MGQLLNKRYQFIKTLGSDAGGRIVLVGDTQTPGHPRCVARQLRLPANNPRTLELSLVVLKKKAEGFRTIGLHPQIPKLIDYFYEGQSFYLVEEFIPGRSLATQIVTGQPWAAADGVNLLRQVLMILQFVHERGTIHRSIQPANLVERQADRRIVLTGFGAFREIGAQVMRAQGKMAAPLHDEALYIAPEQAIGKIEFSSDLYAIGMVAIQALSGKAPRELAQLKNAAGTQPADFNWHRDLKLEPQLAALLNRLVHAAPQERYQTAAEALAALETVSREWPATATLSPLPASSSPERNGNAAHTDAARTALPLLTAELPAPPVPQSPPAVRTAAASPPAVESAPAPRRRRRYLRAGLVAGLVAGVVIAGFGFRVPQTAVSRYFQQRGDRFYAQNDLSAALTAYQQALNWQPESGRALLGRGLVQRDLGNSQAALEDLTAAIQQDPAAAAAYYQRGNLRFTVGDRQGAIEDYTAAIAARPNYAPAYVNRGNARADAGEEPQALADYNQALELDDRLAAAYLNRCLSRSNLGDHAGAIVDCNRAISLEPTSPLAYQNRGLAHRRLGNLQDALADYNIALELEPEDADPYYNRGLTRQELGDLPGAIADFTTAIELNPDHALVYHDRALALARVGDRQAAIADFQKSAQHCLSSGRLGCYDDAQYELARLGASPQEIQNILGAIAPPGDESAPDQTEPADSVTEPPSTPAPLTGAAPSNQPE